MTLTDEQTKILEWLGDHPGKWLKTGETDLWINSDLVENKYIENCCCGMYYKITQAGIDYLEERKDG